MNQFLVLMIAFSLNLTAQAEEKPTGASTTQAPAPTASTAQSGEEKGDSLACQTNMKSLAKRLEAKCAKKKGDEVNACVESTTASVTKTIKALCDWDKVKQAFLNSRPK